MDLYEAYTSGHPEVCAQFAGLPEKLKSIRPVPGIREKGVVYSLNKYNEALGTTAGTVTGKESLVITGQQPGIFTGPLYTIYKAITAIQIALYFKEKGYDTVPIFWIAGDDHDFDEVKTAFFLSRHYEIVPIRYEFTDTSDAKRTPLYRIPLQDSMHQLIDAAAITCFGSEKTAGVVDDLHESLSSARSLEEWFGILMARLFNKTPLRFVTPRLKEFRIAAKNIVEQEIMLPLHTTRLLIEEGEKLKRMGFEIPIKRSDDSCNFFIELDGKRLPVYYREGCFSIGRNEYIFSSSQLVDLLEEQPEIFSANVALRPIIQQFVLAPMAYIAGPGEIAYWAQLKPLFQHFGLQMPIVYPRIQAFIVTTKIKKLLARYGVGIEDVKNRVILLEKMVRAQESQTPPMALFKQERQTLEKACEFFLRQIASHYSNTAMSTATSKFQKHFIDNLNMLEKALLFADEAQKKTFDLHARRFQNTLFPNGHPQERVITIFSFLLGYGWELIDKMMNGFDHGIFTPQEIEV